MTVRNPALVILNILIRSVSFYVTSYITVIPSSPPTYSQALMSSLLCLGSIAPCCLPALVDAFLTLLRLIYPTLCKHPPYPAQTLRTSPFPPCRSPTQSNTPLWAPLSCLCHSQALTLNCELSSWWTPSLSHLGSDILYGLFSPVTFLTLHGF